MVDPPLKMSPLWQEAVEQDLQAIGRRVRAARKVRDISQFDLANEMGVAMNSISSVERGKRATPVPLLKLIAVHLGVDPRDLLGGNPLQCDDE